MIHKTPANYEKKFADFIRLCAEAEANGICGWVPYWAMMGEPSPCALFIHRGELGLRWAMAVSFGGQQDNDDPNFMYSDDALMAEFVPRNG